MKKIAVLAGLSFLAAGAAHAAGPAEGSWNVEGDVAGNPLKLTCKFTQTGPALRGTCGGAQGPAADTEGKVDGKAVSFSYKVDYAGMPLTLAYTGNLESSKEIKGKVEVQGMGAGGDFTATKQ